jgi:hypothetical protein
MAQTPTCPVHAVLGGVFANQNQYLKKYNWFIRRIFPKFDNFIKTLSQLFCKMLALWAY